MMLDMASLEVERSMSLEAYEYYKKSKENNRMDIYRLMAEYWSGVLSGLEIAMGILKPTLAESYYGMPYKEYYYNCLNFFKWMDREKRLRELQKEYGLP